MIERLSLGASLHPQGGYTHAKDYACEDWRAATDTPERPDSMTARRWKLMLDYGGTNQQYGYYWDGLFRYTNGAQCRVPGRWAYLRLRPEIWTGTEFVLPDGSAPAVAASVKKPGVHIDAVAGQQLIDILKRSFTTVQLQDFMDASPYNEPDTGAPEDGAGAPL
jgi:hypothetical protein